VSAASSCGIDGCQWWFLCYLDIEDEQGDAIDLKVGHDACRADETGARAAGDGLSARPPGAGQAYAALSLSGRS
jgi:hypothetical protein